jgi:hypothetical protein
MRAVVMLLPSRSSAADVVLYHLSQSQSESDSVSVSVCLLSRQHGGGFHQHHIISSWLNNTGSVADAKRAVMGI